MTQSYSLNGSWQFTQLSESTLDKSSIPIKNAKPCSMKVPSNWYLQGEDFAGEALYETGFEVPHLQPGQAAFLRFKGSDYFTKVELNGKLLGYHEGYFQAFDLTATQVLEVTNDLKVWVESPKENRKEWPHQKHLIKGIFNHHDARPGSWNEERGQDHNTGGLWNGVELLVVDRVFLKGVKVHPVLLTNGQAVVQFKLILVNVAEADDYDIELKVSGEGFPGSFEIKKNLHLERGQTEAHLSLTLKKPRLWWTWAQGEPALYRAHIGIRRTKTGKLVEEGSVRFGVRDIRVTSQWEFFLNGRKFFPRGTNIIPTQWLSAYGVKEAKRDVLLMKEAHLNAVRVHAHVNRAEFYDACDEAGLFVWQDFALQWSYEPTDAFTRNACRQIKDMVRQLYNHPSIFVWCCHNEPSFNRHELGPGPGEGREGGRFQPVRRYSQRFSFPSLPGLVLGRFGGQGCSGNPGARNPIPFRIRRPGPALRGGFEEDVHPEAALASRLERMGIPRFPVLPDLQRGPHRTGKEHRRVRGKQPALPGPSGQGIHPEHPAEKIQTHERLFPFHVRGLLAFHHLECDGSQPCSEKGL